MKKPDLFLAGPSDKSRHNLYKYGHIKEADYEQYINEIALLLNECANNIGIVPDTGVPLDIIKKINVLPNKAVKVVGYYPKYDMNKVLEKNYHHCDELVALDGGWSAINTQPSKNYDAMVCIGLSAGVFTEIAHTKIHRIWSDKNIPIILDMRVISKELNDELANEVHCTYIKNSQELVKTINSLGNNYEVV